MKAAVYNVSGKEVGDVELPETLFGAKRNDSLVRQVVLALQANARAPYAHTKGRGEVRGGGKKPWKQKGTGRARHGSIRSPIWRGGGTTHGPLSERTYKQKINKRMSAQAVALVLSQKYRDGKLLFVDSVDFSTPKTADAKKTLAGLSKVKGFGELGERRKNAALILTGNRNANASLSFRNMGNVSVSEARSANPVDLMTYRYIVVADPETSVKALAARLKK